MYDEAIVGGGVGGILTGAMLAHGGRAVILFEAMDYLGGCSGTFKRGGFAYNAGATTLVGLSPALPLGFLAQTLGVTLSLKAIDPALRVHLPDREVRMFQNRSLLVGELSRTFPQDDVEGLWKRIFRVSDAAWSVMRDLPPFPPRSVKELRSAARALVHLVSRGGPDVLRSAKTVVSSHVKTPPFRHFLDQLLLITNQAFSDEVPFLAGALGLSYTTLDNYSALGGMGAAAEAFARKIPVVMKQTLVRKIERNGGTFRLHTTRGSFEARRVILNRDVWGAASLFDDPSLKTLETKRQVRYRDRWGAVTLHFMVRNDFPQDFEAHHQIHHPLNPETGSRSFFLSLSEPSDERLSPGGFRSVTISTHTELPRWENLSLDGYREKKDRFRDFVLLALYRAIPEFRNAEKGAILVGTPRTFARYTRRTGGTVGGIPLRLRHFPLGYPSSLTPLENVYFVGDSVFPGQGWPGVAVGAMGLVRRLEPDLLT